jgi:hypothetical protein
MFMILGWEILNIGLIAKVFARSIALEEDLFIEKVVKVVTLERSLIAGGIIALAGFMILARICYIWYLHDFGFLDELKTGLFALSLVVMGIQTIFNAFLLSLMQINYKK